MALPEFRPALACVEGKRVGVQTPDRSVSPRKLDLESRKPAPKVGDRARLEIGQTERIKAI